MNKRSALGLVLLFSFLISCSERDRTNIFDPKARIDTLDISIFITSADSIITVKWFPPTSIHFNGFHIYRKTKTQSNFSKIASLPANQYEYKDYDIAFDVTYSYYLTIQGESTESPPTAVLKVTPGPLSFWILDRFGFNIFKTTYDLQHKRLTKYALWIPENLTFDPRHNLVLVTYPQYRFAEIFDGQSGITKVNLDEFTHPYDCIFEPEQGKFWLTDSSGYLFRVNPIDGSHDIIDQSLHNPTQIIFHNQNIYVIERGRQQIVVYNPGGLKIRTIKNIAEFSLVNPLLIHSTALHDDLYIIDKTSTSNVLYRYLPIQNSAQKIFENEYLKGVQFNPTDNSIWLSIDNELNSKLMQLSEAGDRLIELKGFSSIMDFKINPGQGTIIVSDYRGRIVSHIRQDAETIGIFKEAIYPSKVYSE